MNQKTLLVLPLSLAFSAGSSVHDHRSEEDLAIRLRGADDAIQDVSAMRGSEVRQSAELRPAEGGEMGPLPLVAVHLFP
jgi:hypothetical protein